MAPDPSGEWVHLVAPVASATLLDRVCDVGMGHGGPHGRLEVSIGFEQGHAGFGVCLSPADADELALRILDVTGTSTRSTCLACLIAGAMSGSAVIATIALIIGGFL